MAMKDIGPGKRRMKRAPVYPVGGIMVPFGLYPTAAFALNAGETLTNLSMAGRFISQPMMHPISGAWLEHWVVSVPLSLISKNFFTDIAPVTTGHVAAADTPRFFTKAGGVSLIKEAYDLTVAELFYAPGATVQTIDGVSMVPRMGSDWLENLQVKPASGDPTKWPNQAVQEELTGLDFETERQLTETDTYRDYVQQFQVPDPTPQQSRPRVLRYDRKWSLPQNVLDPASGVPRSAFFFEDRVSLKKDHKAKEPEIVLFLSTFRPLMLQGIFAQSYLSRMVGVKEWLPPHNEAAWRTIQGNDPMFKAGFGVVGDTLVFDSSDTWMRGETFVNCLASDSPYPVPTSTNGTVAAGQDSMRGKFPSLAEIKALFVASASVKDYCMHYQGMLSTAVLGWVMEVADAHD